MKTKIFFIVTIMIIFLAGCEEHLDRKPIGAETTESFLGNPETADENFERMIRACYSVFYINEGSWNNNSHHGEWMTGDWLSDDCEKGGNGAGDFNEVLNWRTWTTGANTGQHHNNFWLVGYLGVGRANAVIDLITKYESNLTPETRNRVKGEAYFIRGWYYFYLAKIYGGVPYFDKPVQPSQYYNQVKLTPEELYAKIEADFRVAADLIPNASDWTDADPRGRATKGSARAALARVLTMEIGFGFNGVTWAQVYEQTSAIINSGEYSLVPNYATIFEFEGELNSESVFEIICDNFNQQPYGCPGGQIQNRMVSPRINTQNTGRRLPQLGWGFSCPSEALYSAFEPGDVRRACTIVENNAILWEDGDPATNEQILTQEDDDCPTGYWFRKYTVPPERVPAVNVNGPSNIRHIRYAEVLLTHAEAAYNTGNTAEALQYVSMVRDRAIASTPPLGSELGNPGYPAAPGTLASLSGSLSGQALLDAIKHERRVELAIEGNRTWDLIRWGEYEDALRNSIIPDDHFLSTRDVNVVVQNYQSHQVDGVPTFPMPADEVEDYGLEQNPNY